MSLHNLTAHELLDKIKSGQTSAADVYAAFQKRIADVDGKVKALIRLAQDAPRDNGGSRPFPIPIAIKDNMCIRDVETTCCSKILKGFRPPYNART